MCSNNFNKSMHKAQPGVLIRLGQPNRRNRQNATPIPGPFRFALYLWPPHAMEPNPAVEADADDDYMGDLSHFLPPSPSRSLGVRKQPPAPAAQARGKAKRGKGLPWKERRRQDRERSQREEDALTLAGMAEAIPESNVGFKLLKQMGYDPAARGGGTEPVGIEIRRSRAGLGAEPPVSVTPLPQPSEPKTREEEEMERKRDEEMVVGLRARKSTQWKGRRMVWNYRKAEAALAQLENQEVAPPAPNGEEKEEEEEEVLQSILDKLRGEHSYCVYCGYKYESAEALANGCPGPNEDDH
ncbi:unnamed protein product [Alopecurus aequalis]